MTHEIEAQPGAEASLRAYSMNERLTALNSLQLGQKVDPGLQLEQVLAEIDDLILDYDRHDPAGNKLANQMQTLDAIFHYMVKFGIRTSNDYFKYAFIAQKLYADSAKIIEARKQRKAMIKS